MLGIIKPGKEAVYLFLMQVQVPRQPLTVAVAFYLHILIEAVIHQTPNLCLKCAY